MMNVKKIKDLYFFHPKSKIKASDGLDEGKYPFYTSSMTQSKWLNEFAFNTKALVFGTGGKASLHFADEMFSISTDCFALSSMQEGVNIKFTYYYLIYNFHIIERGFRGAGLKHIPKEYIENIEIIYPNIDIQNRIISILDKTQIIITKRNKTIQKYEELLQSIFLGMFGTNNPQFKYWKDIQIGNLGKDPKKSFRTGPFGSSLKHDRFKDEGEVAILGIDNVVDNVFKWKKKRFLPINEFEKLSKYQVFPRDVVITIMGTVGRSAVIPQNIGLAINTKHIATITLDESKCNPYYLSYSVLLSPYNQFQLKTKARGAIMDGINLTIVKELQVKNAPIEQQNKFEQIYLNCFMSIEKQILAKEKLNELFNSLSELAFKGELEFGQGIDLEILLDNDYAFFKENSNKKSIQQILDRLDKNELNKNRFYDPDIYDKAKSFIFELLKEGKIEQVFDNRAKTIKLKII
jgi:type I restriction enzyme S subunit